MTDRERLIELIKDAPATDVVYGDIKLPYPRQTVQTIADHLLANGVTVQEWIPVKDRLPEIHQDVLVYQTNGKVLKGWLGTANRWFAPGIVTHWMPLPQPPVDFSRMFENVSNDDLRSYMEKTQPPKGRD